MTRLLSRGATFPLRLIAAERLGRCRSLVWVPML
jgi:hypothetical protein